MGTAEKGDVLVYEPRWENGELRIPVTVTNHGGRRAFYKAAIQISGSNDYRATVRLDTSTTGVYPGTTWPTQLVADGVKRSAPDKLKAVITSSSRDER
ncbi:hypothetical protein [Streptomyces klenkii]|uniref:hypothetical protein n=1 Tax=Streptomyces klenkii TaxID=1420899 RepID=UPI00343637BB